MANELLPGVADREALALLSDALMFPSGDPPGALRACAECLTGITEALLYAQNCLLLAGYTSGTEDMGRVAVDRAALMVLFNLRSALLALADRARPLD